MVIENDARRQIIFKKENIRPIYEFLMSIPGKNSWIDD